MPSQLRYVIDEKLLRIIQLFLNREDDIFHLNKISKEANVSLGTTFRLMDRLLESGLVESVSVGKIRLYRTNKAAVEEFKMLK